MFDTQSLISISTLLLMFKNEEHLIDYKTFI